MKRDSSNELKEEIEFSNDFDEMTYYREKMI